MQNLLQVKVPFGDSFQFFGYNMGIGNYANGKQIRLIDLAGYKACAPRFDTCTYAVIDYTGKEETVELLAASAHSTQFIYVVRSDRPRVEVFYLMTLANFQEWKWDQKELWRRNVAGDFNVSVPIEAQITGQDIYRLYYNHQMLDNYRKTNRTSLKTPVGRYDNVIKSSSEYNYALRTELVPGTKIFNSYGSYSKSVFIEGRIFKDIGVMFITDKLALFYDGTFSFLPEPPTPEVVAKYRLDQQARDMSYFENRKNFTLDGIQSGQRLLPLGIVSSLIFYSLESLSPPFTVSLDPATGNMKRLYAQSIENISTVEAIIIVEPHSGQVRRVDIPDKYYFNRTFGGIDSNQISQSDNLGWIIYTRSFPYMMWSQFGYFVLTNVEHTLYIDIKNGTVWTTKSDRPAPARMQSLIYVPEIDYKFEKLNNAGWLYHDHNLYYPSKMTIDDLPYASSEEANRRRAAHRALAPTILEKAGVSDLPFELKDMIAGYAAK